MIRASIFVITCFLFGAVFGAIALSQDCPNGVCPTAVAAPTPVRTTVRAVGAVVTAPARAWGTAVRTAGGSSGTSVKVQRQVVTYTVTRPVVEVRVWQPVFFRRAGGSRGR